MNIKRTLDTKNATYDITGLTRQQFSLLLTGYEQLSYRHHNGYSEDDELLKKLKQMADNDVLII